MNIHLFDPDRFEPDPNKRLTVCPIGDLSMQVPFRLPDYQKRYIDAKTKRERGKVLADFALKMGISSDNPDVFFQIQADWVEPVEKAA
jgi:hypothetical protein|tara:strand:- start:117 stop:380 length:264 start_codon:yes stop_codon:yes gene_type:complete